MNFKNSESLLSYMRREQPVRFLQDIKYPEIHYLCYPNGYLVLTKDGYLQPHMLTYYPDIDMIHRMFFDGKFKDLPVPAGAPLEPPKVVRCVRHKDFPVGGWGHELSWHIDRVRVWSNQTLTKVDRDGVEHVDPTSWNTYLGATAEGTWIECADSMSVAPLKVLYCVRHTQFPRIGCWGTNPDDTDRIRVLSNGKYIAVQTNGVTYEPNWIIETDKTTVYLDKITEKRYQIRDKEFSRVENFVLCEGLFYPVTEFR